MSGFKILSDGKVYRKMKKVYSNRDVYDGEFVDGLREGKGVMTMSNGDTYQGEFHKDVYHGYGIFQWSPFYDDDENYFVGKRYEGEWSDGKKTGRGVFILGDGGVYSGMFLNNFYHGQGMLKLANGDVIKGEFSRGRASGKILIKYHNGDIYEGEMKSGLFDGNGSYTFNDNMGSYKGNFRKGKYHGSGARLFSDGSKYTGMFSDGHFNGDGIMFLTCGDQYVGEWKNGKMNGQGVYKYARGDSYEGSFLDGFAFGEGKYKYSDGGFYMGEFRNTSVHPVTEAEFPRPNGFRHGFGIRVWCNGNKYEGQWADDRMEGRGVITKAEGGQYEGDIWQGMRHGSGTELFGNLLHVRYCCPMGVTHGGIGFCKFIGFYKRGYFEGEGSFECFDGRTYEGGWKNGKRHGYGVQTYLKEGDEGEPTRMFIGGVGSLYRFRKYEGEWFDGIKEGDGTGTYVNGDQIIGKFAKGLPHGPCEYKFAAKKRVRFALYERGVRKKWLDNSTSNVAGLLSYLNKTRQFNSKLDAIGDKIKL